MSTISLDPISAIANAASSILDRVLPDKAANDAAKIDLAKMQLSGEFQQIADQVGVNKVEAASNSTFVAGWRPFVGWVCGAGLAYQMILRPLLSFCVALYGAHWQAPSIETQDLIALLTGLLGMAGLRTIDKAQGTDNGH